jgi:hypothetical protein
MYLQHAILKVSTSFFPTAAQTSNRVKNIVVMLGCCWMLDGPRAALLFSLSLSSAVSSVLDLGFLWRGVCLGCLGFLGVGVGFWGLLLGLGPGKETLPTAF